jgi:hypothetical protein
VASEIHAVVQDATDIHQVLTNQPEDNDMPWSPDLAFRSLSTRPTQHERIDEYTSAEIGPMADPGALGVLANILKRGAYERIVSPACGEAE